MSEHTPLTVIRDFLRTLPQTTRMDAICHIMMDHNGMSGLRDFDMEKSDSIFDQTFSDESVEIYRYRGVSIFLRAAIDFHIWAFSSNYSKTRNDEFISFARKDNLHPDLLDRMEASFNERSDELRSAAPRWEQLKDGPLSNIAIDEYARRLALRDLSLPTRPARTE